MYKVKKLTKLVLNDRNEVIFKDGNFTFPSKGIVLIKGAIGSGKTTLLNLLSFIDINYKGEIYFCGKSRQDYSKKDQDNIRKGLISLVFQYNNLFDYLSVLDNIILPGLLSGINRRQLILKADALLKRFDLFHLRNRLARNLSGGEGQRISIIRSLLKKGVILLDEPTSSLDEKSTEEVVCILEEIAKDFLLIIVTHNKKITLASKQELYINNKKISSTNDFDEQEKVNIPQTSTISIKEIIRLLIPRLKESIGRLVVLFVVGIISCLSFLISFNSENISDNLLRSNLKCQWGEIVFPLKEKVEDVSLFINLSPIYSNILSDYPSYYLGLLDTTWAINPFQIIVNKSFIDLYKIENNIIKRKGEVIAIPYFNQFNKWYYIELPYDLEIVKVSDNYGLFPVSEVYFSQTLLTDYLNELKIEDKSILELVDTGVGTNQINNILIDNPHLIDNVRVEIYTTLQQLIKECELLFFIFFIFSFITMLVVTVVSLISANVKRMRELLIINALGGTDQDSVKFIITEGLFFAFFALVFSLISVVLIIVMFNLIISNFFQINNIITIDGFSFIIYSFIYLILTTIVSIIPYFKFNRRALLEEIRND